MDDDTMDLNERAASERDIELEMASMFGGREPTHEMAQVLDMLQSLHGKPLQELDAAEARRQPTPMDAVRKLLEVRDENSDPEDVGSIENRTIDGPAGDIDIRIYKPASALEGKVLPVALYVHGGGWVIADIDTYDRSARAICTAAHCIVVATEYRHGPEHRFPAAHDDVYAAYRWTLDNAADLNGDPALVAVVGESAGANMAANVCIRARDEGTRQPVYQVLIYPVAGYDFDTASYREMTRAIPLNTPMMRWFFDNYLHSEADGQSPIINLDDADLSGLAPVTIVSAELDPLRSEGEALARQFQSAGVATEQRTYNGVTHEFFGMGDVLQEAEDALLFAASGLLRAFGKE
ncbi:MAG TPA: alpha/beta hydrolase [Gemmatimonadaceae bacterium]|nr:alpha/beta hydrolase [Gemmatimonadaceae bacterium]